MSSRELWKPIIIKKNPLGIMYQHECFAFEEKVSGFPVFALVFNNISGGVVHLANMNINFILMVHLQSVDLVM